MEKNAENNNLAKEVVISLFTRKELIFLKEKVGGIECKMAPYFLINFYRDFVIGSVFIYLDKQCNSSSLWEKYGVKEDVLMAKFNKLSDLELSELMGILNIKLVMALPHELNQDGLTLVTDDSI